MGGARNLVQDWYNGDLEDEPDFEPIHSGPKYPQNEIHERQAHKIRQKLVDQKRSTRRSQKEELLEGDQDTP